VPFLIIADELQGTISQRQVSSPDKREPNKGWERGVNVATLLIKNLETDRKKKKKGGWQSNSTPPSDKVIGQETVKANWNENTVRK